MLILFKTRDSRVILLIKRGFLTLIQVVYTSILAARATSRKVASSIPDLSFFNDITFPVALWPWRPFSP